jgi:hypothetical protein
MLALDAVQKAVFKQLKAVSCPIYDDVPKSAKFPYIRYDSENIESDKTKTTDGAIHTVYLNVFSQYRGYKEVKTIASEVISKLNEGLALAGNCTAHVINDPTVRFTDDTQSNVRQATIILIVHVTN